MGQDVEDTDGEKDGGRIVGEQAVSHFLVLDLFRVTKRLLMLVNY